MQKRRAGRIIHDSADPKEKSLSFNLTRQPGGGGVSIEAHHAEAILRFDKDLVKIIEKPATKHPLTDAESLC